MSKAFYVTTGESQERRPVRPVRVARAMLTERNVPIGHRLNGWEFVASHRLPPKQPIDRAGPYASHESSFRSSTSIEAHVTSVALRRGLDLSSRELRDF